MKIEYVVTFGKNGPTVSHRVTNGCGCSSDTGGNAPPPPDYGGNAPPPPDYGGNAPPPPDYGGNPALNCGCPSIIVMGPTVITGLGTGTGTATSSNGLTFTRRPIPKTHVIPGNTTTPITVSKASVNGLTLEYQKQFYWCWAAVASAVRDVEDPTKPLSQCEVADVLWANMRMWGLDTSPVFSACATPSLANKPESLQQTLASLANLQSVPEYGGVASFRLIQEEILAGRPIGCRIAWDTNNDGQEEGAHFILISGWEVIGGVEHITVLDPDGKSDQAGKASGTDYVYSKFAELYEDSGKWMCSYLVKG